MSALLIVGFSALGWGCEGVDEPAEPGSLVVAWQLSAGQCEARGVDQISVQLINDTRQSTHSAACQDGQVVVSDIEPAAYEMTLIGLDKDARAVADSAAVSVDIEAGAHQSLKPLLLREKPPVLSVGWRFINAMECGEDSVQVTVHDAQNREVSRQTFRCADGMGVVSGLKMAGDYTVAIGAVGNAGRIFNGRAKVKLERGEEKEMKLVLTPRRPS